MARPDRLSSRDELLRSFAWAAIVVGAFVLSRPYVGIKHDAILYLAQALSRLHPEIFQGDVFFRWGSQDRYTLFTPLYSLLITRLGLNYTNVALVLSSQALFLAGSYRLVRALIQPGLRGYAMLVLVCSSGLYGSFFVFRMGEPFVTPRPFVEAATLFALSLLVSGRRGWSLALLAAGATLHPLMALAGMLYWWMYEVIQDRRWVCLAVLGIVPAAAGLAGIAPFTQLFLGFDAQWLNVLLDNNHHLFVTRWSLMDWAMVAFDALVLSMGVRLAEGKLRAALQAAIAVAILGLAATFVGADLLQNVLLANLQFWRVLWIVHWMAVVTLPYVMTCLWRQGSVGQLVAGLAIFGFITRGLPPSLAATLIAMTLFHYRDRLAAGQRLVQIALWAIATGAFVNWFNNVSREHDTASFESLNPIVDFIVRSVSKPFALLVIAATLAWFGLMRRNPRPAALLAAGFLVAACFAWDQRTPYRAFIESSELGSHPFSRFVAPQQEVLWYGDAVEPWILMQRKSYVSIPQQAGQMFNRETAIDLQQRWRVLALLTFQETVCELMNNLNHRYDACEPDREIIGEVCRDAPGLGYIVLATRIENKWVASWTPPVEIGGRSQHYYLYDCKILAQE